MDINTIRLTTTNFVGRSGLLLKKYAPEILLGGGILTGVVSGVMACKATLKLEEATEDFRTGIKYVKESTYADENSRKKDLAFVYGNAAGRYIHLYGPAFLTGAVSISMILASHGLMAKRQASIVAAYAALNKAYSNYKKRVSAKIGEGNATPLDQPPWEETPISEELQDLHKKELDFFEPSPYARWFNESSPMFKRDNLLNHSFLISQQRFANQMLQTRGHVFLNEVYDSLGIPRSREGAIVGWVKDSLKGDGHIDFNMYAATPQNEDFVNGYTKHVFLEFNVDGVIYDLI